MKGHDRFMQLIIHADDFGINESVSNCIAECFAKGWVTETSLMVNMPYADEAVELARKSGFADKVALHLNLSQGMPMTEDIRRFSRLCNPDGSFNKQFHHKLVSRFILSRSESAAIKKEIVAQIDKFCSYGGLMMKLDSHHHVHTDWSIYRILEPIAIAKGFKSMRISATLHKVGLFRELYKRYLNGRIRQRFATTDHFDGYSEKIKNDLLFGHSVELMTHPMYSVKGEILDSKRPYTEIVEALNV